MVASLGGHLTAPGALQFDAGENTHEDARSADELAQVRKEVELLKAADPFNVLELVIELQIERQRSTEAIHARDALAHRLADACESLRQKMLILETLEKDKNNGAQEILRLLSAPESPEISRMRGEIVDLQGTIVSLEKEIKVLKDTAAATSAPQAGSGSQKVNAETSTDSALVTPITSSPQTPREGPFDPRLIFRTTSSEEPADLVRARNAVLASLPLPEEVPEDTLSPLSIPTPFTLQEFISNLSGPLRTSLSHYRLFYALTTLWCPEREEHGYFYTPAFKCSTNPRVTAAHRWSPGDVIGRMNRPTECFFNKDGTWYYAGLYKAFRLDDLSAKEWANLPDETRSALVKETIAARKNVSPQNMYEVGQLYAAGALKVACVGLQCVGFNNAMYKALLEQAATFSANKWKVVSAGILSAGSGGGGGGGGGGGLSMGLGISGPGSRTATPSWHRPMADVMSGMGGLSLGSNQGAEGRGEGPQDSVGDNRKR